eukprot:COSAG02_NODE_2406_length_8930_cov_10.414676_4_plen_996_part_00
MPGTAPLQSRAAAPGLAAAAAAQRKAAADLAGEGPRRRRRTVRDRHYVGLSLLPGDRQRRSRWSPSVQMDSMETERPSSRVTFSRGEDNTTREFDPIPLGAEGLPLPASGLVESASLPNISANSTNAQRRQKRRKRSRRARPAPRQPEGSHVGTVGGACTGRGLPRVSASASFSGPLEPLGLEYEGFGQGISFSASARDWGGPPQGLEDTISASQEWAGTTQPLPAPVMDMPTRLFTRESDLIAAEKRYTDHVSHVQQARRMIDVQTPHGYRAYRSRHENVERSSDGLHSWLARPGMASSLAPLSKMTLPRRRQRTSGFGTGFGTLDPDASAMDDFYAQMQAIEQQMHQSPLCLAHEVMARLAPPPVPGLDEEAAYVDAAATKIQSVARGRIARRDLADQDQAARKIQARVRGFQTRAERREAAIQEAKAAADEAAAVYAKEEAEAVAAEAAYAKEEAEALAAEAAHRKEEAEALAAEADARREEEEALVAEANARREEAEAVEAEKAADREEEEARIANEVADKETEEARVAQAAALKEEEEARIAAESALKEEEEARLAAEAAAKEEAEAEAARLLAAKEEEEARLAREKKAKEEADVQAAEKVLADAVASGDEAAIAAATEALQKEKDEAAAASAAAQREEEEAAAAKAEAEREAAEAKEAAEKAAQETAEAALAAEVLEKEKAEAEEARLIAEKEQAEADEAQRIAEKEQAEAEEARRVAEKERAEAEEAAAIAERERREAEEAKIVAERERAEAEAARIIAEKERAEAEAARIVAERERAEADAAKAEADRLAGIAKALEEEANEEKFAHQAALAAVAMPDTPPPERFVKKKKKGFGRGLLKILAGGKDRGLPPALHVRMMGTKRPAPSYGDNAMLVTLEIRTALNIKGLMPELLVENGAFWTALSLHSHLGRLLNPTTPPSYHTPFPNSITTTPSMIFTRFFVQGWLGRMLRCSCYRRRAERCLLGTSQKRLTVPRLPTLQRCLLTQTA